MVIVYNRSQAKSLINLTFKNICNTSQGQKGAYPSGQNEKYLDF